MLELSALGSRFGTKFFRQIVGISMGTNCAPIVADLFLFCYERDLMKYFSNDYQADIIKAFNSTSRYLDDQIYPPELQQNKAFTSDAEAPFWIYTSLFVTTLFPQKI